MLPASQISSHSVAKRSYEEENPLKSFENKRNTAAKASEDLQKSAFLCLSSSISLMRRFSARLSSLRQTYLVSIPRDFHVLTARGLCSLSSGRTRVASGV